MARLFAILGTMVLAGVLLYVSRFWIWQAPWGANGLLGIKILSPDGDVLRRLIRGTSIGVFELVVWVGLVFACLSALQWLHDRTFK